jgi:hypothetical protein
MNLWVLTRRVCRDDSVSGMAVMAASRLDARRIAAAFAGHEGPAFWMDPRLTTCVELWP